MIFDDINIADVVDYEINKNSLLVTTIAKHPAMVDKLIKFNFASEDLAGDAIEILHGKVSEHEQSK